MKAKSLEGIRAVVFDAVGTVILPNPGAATVYAAAAARHAITFDVASLSQRIWERYAVEDQADRAGGWRTSEARERERWRNIVEAAIPGAGADLFEELFQHFSMPSAWFVMDGVAETLRELESRGFVLALASNYDRRLESVVAGLPALAPLRQRLVISSVVGFRKPALEFFRDGVLPTVGCEAGEVLFVGDDLENDIHGAWNAGMRAVLFDPKGKYGQIGERIAKWTELIE